MIRLQIVSPILALRLGLRSIFSEYEEFELLRDLEDWDQIDSLDRADVFILDQDHQHYSLGKEGLETFKTPPGLLLLSENAEDANQLRDLPLRAWGIIPNEANEEELLAAVHALHQGLLVGSPMLIEAQLSVAVSFKIDDSDELLESLSERELEVLQALAQGLPNKQIALELSISEHTVKFHSSAIYSKLNVSNRTEAVRRGVRLGLITY